MTKSQWKIALINIMLAMITITILFILVGMTIGWVEKDTSEFLALTGLIGSLIGGFFYELKLLHNKDGK